MNITDLNVTNISLAVIVIVTIYTILRNLPLYIESWTKLKQVRINNNEIQHIEENLKLSRKINVKISRIIKQNSITLSNISEELKSMREHNKNLYEKMHEFEKNLIRWNKNNS